MMKRKAWVSMMLMAALIAPVTGCQNTPGQSPSVSKNDSSPDLSELVHIGVYNCPDAFRSSFSQANVSIEYHAKVRFPQIQELLQYQYANRFFTDGELARLIENLYGGSAVYQQTITKEDYAQEYFALQEMRSSADDSGEDMTAITERLKELEALIGNAPSKDMLQPVEIRMQDYDGFHSF